MKKFSAKRIAVLGVLLAAFIVMWLLRLLRGGSGFTVYTYRDTDGSESVYDVMEAPSTEG